jgi:hypothetical protein
MAGSVIKRMPSQVDPGKIIIHIVDSLGIIGEDIE